MRSPRWLLVVVATLLVAEGAARLVGPHIPETDERGHPELEAKWADLRALSGTDASPEMVAFGNSMVDGDLIPSVFSAAGGPATYNAGFLNAPIVTLERWSQMVVDEVEPSTALVMIHPLDTIEGGSDVSFGQDGGTLATSFEDALDQLEPGPLDRLGDRAESVSALVSHRSALRQPGDLWRAVEDTINGEPRPLPARIDEAAPLHEIDWDAVLDDQGWNDRFVQPQLSPDLTVDLGFVGRRVSSPTFDDAPVRDLMRSLTAEVDRVVLVIPPVALAILDRNGIPSGPLRARADELGRIARAAGAEVVDMSGEAYPVEMFHDPVHLARAGAERFSRELAAAMAR